MPGTVVASVDAGQGSHEEMQARPITLDFLLYGAHLKCLPSTPRNPTKYERLITFATSYRHHRILSCFPYRIPPVTHFLC